MNWNVQFNAPLDESACVLSRRPRLSHLCHRRRNRNLLLAYAIGLRRAGCFLDGWEEQMKTLHFAAASLAISAVFAVAQNKAPVSGVPLRMVVTV